MLVTDTLTSYTAAKQELAMGGEHRPVADYWKARAQAFRVWAEVSGAPLAA